MYRVKVCGITREEDVRSAVSAGADALGFQMSMGRRKIALEKARALVRVAPPLVTTVGVFVDEPLSFVLKAVRTCGFQAVQLHGGEGPGYCRKVPVPVVKVVRMKGPSAFKGYEKYDVAAYLLDAYHSRLRGGTGRSFPAAWAVRADRALPGPVLLAGGLTPDNVAGAVRASGVFGVDVASGVESAPGVKDPRKVRLFVERAMKALKAARK